MMSRPDQRVMTALSTLEGNPDFEVFMAWVRQSKEDLVSAGMYSKDEVLTRWSQGAFQALDALVGQAESARKNLRK